MRILVDWYPITVEELRDELGLRKDVLERALKSLVVKGVIQLEPLPDKVYVRLLIQNIDIKDVLKDGKQRRRRKPSLDEDRGQDDSLMYR